MVNTIVIFIAKVNQMWFYYVIINSVVVIEQQKDILERVIKAVILCFAGLRVPNTHKITNKTDTGCSGTQGLMHERLNQMIHRFKEALHRRKGKK
jgi:hypothetical protein